MRKLAILHITHSWGGGIARWISDFCKIDTIHSNFIFASETAEGFIGRSGFLTDGNSGLVIKHWKYSNPIPEIAFEHAELDHIIDEITKKYDIGRICVSSLIGHSQSILRYPLPITIIHHDFSSFCPALHLFNGKVCTSCTEAELSQCIAENPMVGDFRFEGPKHWLSLRNGFFSASNAETILHVCPSGAVPAMLRAVDARFSAIDFKVIEHGIAYLPRDCFGGGERQRLKVVVLGHLHWPKGLEFFRRIYRQLADMVDLVLLGSGFWGREFYRHSHIKLIESYAQDELPSILEALKPDLGIFFSKVPETFSYTLSELNAHRIPVCAPKLGSFAYRIGDGVNGFLYEPDEPSFFTLVNRLHADRAAIRAVYRVLRESDVRSLAEMVADYYRLADEVTVTDAHSFVQESPEPSDCPLYAPNPLSFSAPIRPDYRFTHYFYELKQEVFQHIEQNIPLELYAGNQTSHLVSGWIHKPGHRLTRIELWANGKRCEAQVELNIPRPECYVQTNDYSAENNSTRSGYQLIFPLDPAWAGQTVIFSLVAFFSDGSVCLMGEPHTRFLQPDEYFAAVPSKGFSKQGPRVAIAMATFNPTPELLHRQILSIKIQDHENWICVISDDHSAPEFVAAIKNEIRDDPRFVLKTHEQNVGVYRNFERVLRYVPQDCEYVCLADQDDVWYSFKISRLLAEIETRANCQLAYSDMRIVAHTEGGHQLMAPSYWTFRRNQYEDLARLLASNTVTGAAAILRRSLLDHALPFPQALGESYHDHYLACAALAFGTIGYVDDVLYDYVQTGRNVTGHVVQARYSPFPPGAVRALLHPRSRKDAFIRIRQSLLDYHLGYTKLQLTSKLLRDRGSRHPALKLFDGTGYSIPRLMREWLRNLTSRTDERFNLGYFLASRATRQATQWYLTAIRSFRRRRGTGKCSASKRA